MKIIIRDDIAPIFSEPRVGNVYPVRGGRGLRDGHMMVLIAITAEREYHGSSALFLVINKLGWPQGVTHYGLHVLDEWSPLAFVDGLDDLELVLRSI